MKQIFPIAIIACLVLSFTTCNSQELSSVYSQSERVIDGSVDEWNENEMVFLEKQDVMVGVVNNDEYLYLGFYSTSRERAMQLMQSGFTIWLNAKGKKKDFGIRYPIRDFEVMEKQMPARDFKHETMSKESEMDKERSGFMEKVDKNLVIIDGKDEKEYKIEYLQDIQVAFTIDREMFMYELIIPLTEEGHKYSIEPTDKNVIYVGIETEKVTRPQRPSDGSGRGGPPPGGMGQRPQGEPGGRGGGQMGEMSEMPSKFEVWLKIQLGTPAALENE